jgi:hypothetical protein
MFAGIKGFGQKLAYDFPPAKFFLVSYFVNSLQELIR